MKFTVPHHIRPYQWSLCDVPLNITMVFQAGIQQAFTPQCGITVLAPVCVCVLYAGGVDVYTHLFGQYYSTNPL